MSKSHSSPTVETPSSSSVQEIWPRPKAHNSSGICSVIEFGSGSEYQPNGRHEMRSNSVFKNPIIFYRQFQISLSHRVINWLARIFPKQKTSVAAYAVATSGGYKGGERTSDNRGEEKAMLGLIVTQFGSSSVNYLSHICCQEPNRLTSSNQMPRHSLKMKSESSLTISIKEYLMKELLSGRNCQTFRREIYSVTLFG